MVGGYQLISKIAEGGMGEVWLAEQQRPRRKVALKLIRRDLVSEHTRRRFDLEAEALGRLSHDGVARVYEAGVDPTTDQPFYAMEFIEGQRLDEWALHNDPPTHERLRVLIAICRAVQHAHQKGVVHRDLKPGNILVTPAGEVKVLDFGLARLTDADATRLTRETNAGQVLGTLAYMAPEQASGRIDQVDALSDIYALGVIAYELLCGALPIDMIGKPLPAALRMITEDEPSRLSAVDHELRGDLETIVGKAMSKDRDRRYDSAAGLAEDVRRFLDYEPITARPPGLTYVLRKFAQRNRLLVTAVSVVAVLVLGGLVTVQRVAAQRAAARTEAAGFSGVLANLIEAHDPEVAGEPQPEAALALRRALEADRGVLAEVPQVEVDLRRRLASLLINLGLLEEGSDELRAALEVLDKDATADPAVRAQVAALLQVSRWRSGDAAAIGPLQVALAEALRDLPADDPVLSFVRVELANAYKNATAHLPLDDRLAALQKAERLYRQALAATEAATGRASDDMPLTVEPAVLRMDLAQLDVERGIALHRAAQDADGDEASELHLQGRSLYERALADLERQHGEAEATGHRLRRLEIASEMAKLHDRLGHFEAADALYRETLVGLRGVLPFDHFRVRILLEAWHEMHVWLVGLDGDRAAELLDDPSLDGRTRRAIDALDTIWLLLRDDPANRDLRQRVAGDIASLHRGDAPGLNDAGQWETWIAFDNREYPAPVTAGGEPAGPPTTRPTQATSAPGS